MGKRKKTELGNKYIQNKILIINWYFWQIKLVKCDSKGIYNATKKIYFK